MHASVEAEVRKRRLRKGPGGAGMPTNAGREEGGTPEGEAADEEDVARKLICVVDALIELAGADGKEAFSWKAVVEKAQVCIMDPVMLAAMHFTHDLEVPEALNQVPPHMQELGDMRPCMQGLSLTPRIPRRFPTPQY